jgi:hypothetical protein
VRTERAQVTGVHDPGGLLPLASVVVVVVHFFLVLETGLSPRNSSNHWATGSMSTSTALTRRPAGTARMDPIGPRMKVRGLQAHEPNSVLVQRQLDHSSKSTDVRGHRLSSVTQVVGLCLQPLQVDERQLLILP